VSGLWEKHPNARRWKRRLLEDSEIGEAISRKALMESWVEHDGWCRLINNAGPCNCDPITSIWEVRSCEA